MSGGLAHSCLLHRLPKREENWPTEARSRSKYPGSCRPGGRLGCGTNCKWDDVTSQGAGSSTAAEGHLCGAPPSDLRS